MSTPYATPTALTGQRPRPDFRRDRLSATLALLLTAAPGAQAAGPAASFGPITDFTVGQTPAVALGDVNDDGQLDLVTANLGANTASVLLGNGNGTFAAKTDFPTGADPYSVALGDVNADGKLDLVTPNAFDDTASVLLGDGLGSFATKVDSATGAAPRSVALGDVNGDGKLDLVTANYGGDNASVLIGNGLGGFPAKTDFGTGSFPNSVALGDVNGDGKLDLVTANSGDNTASVLIGDGIGGFAAKSDFETGIVPQSVALGDVNGDGKLDLVTANNGQSASVLIGDGNGGFADKTDFPAGGPIGGPTSVALGDVNGDGKLDLVTANYISDTASVLLGNGDGSFEAKNDWNTGSIWNAVLGDVNADGRLDLVTATSSGNTASVRLNTTVFNSLAVTFGSDTLNIAPPPVQSCEIAPSEYVIHYNTPARLAASQPWGIWARGWPSTIGNLPLWSTETAAGCKSLGGATATCFRPAAIGLQSIGETYVYRVYAKCNGVWTLPSPTLSVTR